MNRTKWCVSEFARNNISNKIEVQASDMNMDLSILDEGINVKATYPLNFRLAEQELFHLSQFDFFYPSKLKSMLDSAVAFPLRMDWQYADFTYNETTLESPYFTYGSEIEVRDCSPFNDYFWCGLPMRSDQYRSLSLGLRTSSMNNGDDLFTFHAPAYTILDTPEIYTYQMVRHNRAPALDYIGRMACPAVGYDYVVIKDDLEGLGVINISLNAFDPDEDQVNYTIESQEFGNSDQAEFVYKPLQKGLFTLKASAIDEHDIRDWQEVRILVDRPLQLSTLLDLPYNFRSSE
ncbi:MAG: hypothetical protein AABX05_02775, partial [Nanoarchaeota archaeon]